MKNLEHTWLFIGSFALVEIALLLLATLQVN